MVDLIPITKVDERKMVDISMSIPTQCVVVRLLDLISSKTLNLNETFFKIKKAGGIHNYLGCDKEIILSLIVKDDMISRLTYQDYAYIIKNIKPSSFTTPDCETYDNETEVSIEEIKKSLLQTKPIIELCPECKPIGHVKGCDEFLVSKHVELLKSLGVKDFVFHIGDFARHADSNMINKAKNLAFKIRPHADRLFLYGMGSQNNLIGFSFADYYVTNNHFVTARYGMKFLGTKKVKYQGKYNLEIVRSNLFEMYKNIRNMCKQQKLIEGGEIRWVAEQEENALAIA